MPLVSKKLVLAIFLLCIVCEFVNAQSDSLKKNPSFLKIEAMRADTNKVMAYNAFLENSSTNGKIAQPDLITLALKMKNLSEKLNFLNGRLRAYHILSALYSNAFEYTQAMAYANKLANLSEKSGRNEAYTLALATIGSIYRSIKEYEKAISYYQQSLAVAKKISDNAQAFSALSWIGICYDEWGKYDLALHYDKQMMELAEKLNNLDYKVYGYCQLAWHLYQAKNYLEAYRYCQLYFAVKDKYPHLYGSTIGTLGAIYRDAPAADLAKMGIKPQDRLPKMLEYFSISVNFARQSDDIYILHQNLKDLSDVYTSMGEDKKALKAYKEYVLLRDSIYNQDKQKAVIQQQLKEEYTRKTDSLKFQQKLTTVKVTQQRNYFIGGLALVLIVTFFVFRNSFIQRKLNKIIIQEKKRSDDLLENILPVDVAEELKQKGTANARMFDEVTVLFTDFVNFTNVSEMLSPQELVDELNQCFIAFDRIMEKYGIEKIKTIGDAYLAVAGLPAANDHHANIAIQAALEIRQFIVERKKTENLKGFDIRIGIHSGSVVAGIVGVKKFAYDIWGDTVNTAARLEQNSLAGKINVSEKTYMLTKDQFTFQYRGEIAAKNKGELKMFFVEPKSS